MRRWLLPLAALAAAVALVSAASPATRAEQGLAWKADGNPFRLQFSAGGKVLTAQATGEAGPDTRLSYTLANGRTHTVTKLLSTSSKARATTYTVATDESGRTAHVTVRRTPQGARVTWRLQPATGVQTVFEALRATRADHFLGAGEQREFVDLAHRVAPLKVNYTCQYEMPVPFFASSAGFGIYARTSAVGSVAFPGAKGSPCAPWGKQPCPSRPRNDRIALCFRDSSLSYDVLAGAPKQALRSFVALTGRPVMPPPDQFALIKWRENDPGTKELLADADELQKRNIPLGWMLLDSPWEDSTCLGTFEWWPSKFPSPKGLVQQLHARGVKLMLWISPLYKVTPPEKHQCAQPPYPKGTLHGSGDEPVIDFTNPAARDIYAEKLRTLLPIGVDGVKADRGDEVDLEGEGLTGGSGTLLHNRYPLQYAQLVARAFKGRKGFATMFRAATTGSQSVVPGFWGGDEPGNFRGLQESIRAAPSAGASGFSTWGSDIGGYSVGSPPLSAEAFVRWAQFAAVTPLFEVGGQTQASHFWDFGAGTVARFRDAAVLHYELFPYLFELARQAHLGAGPILRPLALEYPADAGAWKADLQLLVGTDLLAAPVTSSGTSTRVYLPRGAWVDLGSGARRAGGRSFTRRASLDELPLFLRAGAAIPFNLRANIWRQPWGTNDLQRKGRAGWLYAPGAAADTQVPGAGRLRTGTQGRTVTLKLSGAPRETQILVALQGKPGRVTIDGRAVPASAANDLKGRAQGWTFLRGAFGGVLLKLGRAATVTIAR